MVDDVLIKPSHVVRFGQGKKSQFIFLHLVVYLQQSSNHDILLSLWSKLHSVASQSVGINQLYFYSNSNFCWEHCQPDSFQTKWQSWTKFLWDIRSISYLFHDLSSLLSAYSIESYQFFYFLSFYSHSFMATFHNHFSNLGVCS